MSGYVCFNVLYPKGFVAVLFVFVFCCKLDLLLAIVVVQCLSPADSLPPHELHHVTYRSLLKLMSIESVMPSNRLIFCCPLLFLLSVFPSIRVFSTGSQSIGASTFQWTFSLSNEHSGLISLLSKGLSSLLQHQLMLLPKHQFFGSQPSLWPTSHISLEKP